MSRQKKEINTIYLTVKQLKEIYKKLQDLYDNCEMEFASFTQHEEDDVIVLTSTNDNLLEVEFNLHFEGSIWEKVRI